MCSLLSLVVFYELNVLSLRPIIHWEIEYCFLSYFQQKETRYNCRELYFFYFQLSHFNRLNNLRIVCDARHDTRYSTNELELLAIVWAGEHFRNYVY